MKKYIYMAVAAIAALSSCSSDNDIMMEETAKQPLIFTASMEGVAMEGVATRVAYDSENKCASWENGDLISINGKGYKAQSTGLTTTFTPSRAGQEATPDADGKYNTYFPGVLIQPVGLAFLSSYTWAADKFNMPMYASSTTTDLQFKNLCGVLKITAKSDQIDQVKSITLSSANKGLSGKFTVVNDAAVLDSPYATDPTRTLTVDYSTAVPTTEEGKVFYVPIPVATDYRELNIAISNGITTKHMTTKAGTNIAIERNKIYPITLTGNKYSAEFNTGSDGSFSRDTDKKIFTASNSDVTIKLVLSQGQWDKTNGQISGCISGTLKISVTPESWVSGIDYRTFSGTKTFTGSGPWTLTVQDNQVMDGTTNLGSSFRSIIVRYTKN